MEKLNWVSTVVGSFPRENTQENMEKSFKDQIDAGVDFPCYPQLVSMIDQFLEPLSELDCGLVKKDNRYYLERELTLPDKPFALEYGEFVIKYLEKHPESKEKIKGWKACLTGPFTLAGEIHINPELMEGKRLMVYQEPRAIMKGELVEKLAKIMAMIAKEYNKMGADIISMDEPTLALIVGRRKAFFHKDDTIIDYLNTAIKPIEKYSSVHVCGNVSPKLLEILLQTNVKIHDHEFANGSNRKVFEREMFEGTNKTLAYGTLLSNVLYKEGASIEDYVESKDVIKDRVLEAKEKFGKENIMFKPDCGFGGLLATFGEEMGSEIVKRKLTNLNQVLLELK